MGEHTSVKCSRVSGNSVGWLISLMGEEVTYGVVEVTGVIELEEQRGSDRVYQVTRFQIYFDALSSIS